MSAKLTPSQRQRLADRVQNIAVRLELMTGELRDLGLDCHLEIQRAYQKTSDTAERIRHGGEA